MKIAYFGYDYFVDCLRSVIAQHQLVKLFTCNTDNKYNFNREIIAIANQYGCPIQTQKTKLNDIEALGDCDLVISAAYPYKIPTIPNLRGVNIHPTLLPEGRGPWPLPHIILKGLSSSGVSLHQLADQFDQGDIISQKSFEVLPQETIDTLGKKCKKAATLLLSNFLENIEEQWANAKPQGNGSWWKTPSDEDQTIDWNNGVEKIDRVIRAFGSFESMAVFDNQHWVIRKAKCTKQEHSYQPGTQVKENTIAAKDGFIELIEYDLDKDFL